MEGDLLCLEDADENEIVNLVDTDNTTVVNVDCDEDAAAAAVVTGVSNMQQDTKIPAQKKQQTTEMSNQGKKRTLNEEEREERKKRRRMIRRMLEPGATPSFVALITPRQEGDDDNNEEEAPKRVRIDVDEYLGLKQKKMESPEAVQSAVVAATSILPSEEGWFEGVVPLSLPGEERFIPELQVVIRSNLELFSATEADVRMPQPGRRTKTVRGKVGIRCIHCARAIKENPSLPWPAASISFPANIVGLYPVCTQKPQLHFEKCPHMPAEMKARLLRLTFDDEGGPRRLRKATPGVSKDKSVSTVLYYTIAAKMIGLVDVPSGIRFGRDLTLEPLPMETVRAQIEDTRQPYKRSGGNVQAKPPPVTSSEPRIAADVDSERVLAQAVAEKDNENLLAKSDDKKLVSDFIFLCIKQMAICHAVKSDFATRGKKTRLMRLGFAGFCCRHCARFNADDPYVHNVQYSCRSFSSAADNLASAISNSFYLHIQKCPAVPLEIRRALTAYKRLHSRQMAQLSYGSQRRMFLMMWSRLRAADLSEEEVEEKTKLMPPTPEPIMSSLAASSVAVQDAASASAKPDAALSAEGEDVVALGRRGPMPVSDDEETIQVLKKAEENWDPTVNDSLVVPTDRHFITDFVFLMMRQLKAAHPTQIDLTRGKRITAANASQAGLKCIHCMNQPQAHFFSAVGRSFPSAPDNMASTLNSSMFHHMQKCQFIPEDVKQALANLKKIHSAQCASLRFGSQRRFFNLVFERLLEAPIDEADANAKVEGPDGELEDREADSLVKEADDEMLRRCGFVEMANGCFECQFCRMVPFALRAGDSVAIGRPQVETVEGHQKSCRKDSLYLGYAAKVLKEATDKHPTLRGGAIFDSPAFATVLWEATGQEVGKAISDALRRMMEDTEEAEEGDNQPNLDVLRGLWSKIPSSVNVDHLSHAFTLFASSVPGLEPDLVKQSHFLRFLQMISPSLVVEKTAEATTTSDTQG